jgi:23S rRNA pseudouridine2605 synthase
VFDLLAGAGLPHVGAVGRLDLESEGLLLFTNDTRWAHRIAAPDRHVDKVYHVQVDRIVEQELLQKLQAGVMDKGERLRAQKARMLTASGEELWLEIVLNEGKNRQIRRMLATLGVRVLRLKRVAVGALKLGSLKPGEFRALSTREVAALSR